MRACIAGGEVSYAPRSWATSTFRGSDGRGVREGRRGVAAGGETTRRDSRPRDEEATGGRGSEEREEAVDADREWAWRGRR